MFKACGFTGDKLWSYGFFSTASLCLLSGCGCLMGFSMIFAQSLQVFIDRLFYVFASVGAGFSMFSTSIATNKTNIKESNLGVL